MAEPTSTTATIGIYGLFVAIFGMVAGEWAVIVFAALAGGMWAIGNIKTVTKTSAGWLLLKIVLTAAVLAGAIASVIEAKFGWPVKQVLAPLAFLIGFFGNRWNVILNRWIDKVSPAFISK